MADVELVYPGNPFGLGTRPGAIASSIYVSDDDTLVRIITANSAPGVVIGLTGLRVDDTGQLQPIDELHTPNTDRSSKTQDYGLGKGTLLRLTAFVVAGTPLVGQTYVSVQLVRGISGPRRIISTLLGGYITAVQALGFPGSPVVSSTDGEPAIRFISGTTPAAGAEVLEVVPTGARWELLTFEAILTAFAAGVNRQLTLGISFAARAFGFYPCGFPVVPGGFVFAHWAQNFPAISNAALSVSVSAIPQRLILLAGAQIVTLTVGLNPNDQYAASLYTVREWLEVAA